MYVLVFIAIQAGIHGLVILFTWHRKEPEADPPVAVEPDLRAELDVLRRHSKWLHGAAAFGLLLVPPLCIWAWLHFRYADDWGGTAFALMFATIGGIVFHLIIRLDPTLAIDRIARGGEAAREWFRSPDGGLVVLTDRALLLGSPLRYFPFGEGFPAYLESAAYVAGAHLFELVVRIRSGTARGTYWNKQVIRLSLPATLAPSRAAELIKSMAL